jgi:hypothetical protein
MSTLNRSIVAAAATLILGACVPVRVRMADPTLPRASICPEAVTTFATPAEVGKGYVEVAQLSAGPFGAHFVPSTWKVEEAKRKKAAQLGANGIILRHALGGRELLYDDVVAIFIPADSARAAEVCAAARGRE